jgi:flagellar hook-basal body complex protein FliE
MILPISTVAPIAMPSIAPMAGAAQSSGEFQNILSTAIDSIQSAQTNAGDAVQKFISGENEELHTTILATQKADMAFQLGLQVRNKVVDAYQEIMKMQM